MSYPQAINSAITSNNTGAQSYALNMPSSIIAGRLLLLDTFYGGASGYDVTGWTLLVSAARADNAGISAVWAKKAAGGDTATVSINGGSNQNGCAIIRQISGWSGVLSEILATGSNGGAGSVPIDSPSLTATYFRDNLWLSSGQRASATADTVPPNYVDLQTAVYTTSLGSLVSAVRPLTALTENPGAFAASGAQTTRFTVAVPPPVLPQPTPPPARRIRASSY